MKNAALLVGFALFVGLEAGTPPVPNPSQAPIRDIDQSEVQQTVEALRTALNREYFDPVVAAKVSETLQRRLAGGRYQGAPTIESLAKTLTEDLFEITRDKHLVVSSVPKSTSDPATPTAADDTSREVAARRLNFGIQRIEILPGNVGYLNLTAFYRPGEVREAMASAMANLRNTDALILDLRNNGGGSSGTIALFASYFFETQGLPLFEVVPRPPATPVRFSTESGVLADRNQQRPTYVLTSQNTWSAGEGFALILQEHHRAEVIGQTTGGAGNQARPHLLNAKFEVTIPNGKVRTVLRGQSWEGTGVVPDIPATSTDALRIAQVRALQGLIRKVPSGAWHDSLEKQLALLGDPKS